MVRSVRRRSPASVYQAAQQRREFSRWALSVFRKSTGGEKMYRALYRKWRPMRFEDVVGQTAIVTALQNQITTGRVGHAYLFTGTRGTGKTTCAKIFAKAVNCVQGKNGDPCGQCEVCRGIDSGSILDVVEIDAASNNGVDNIRDLRDETAYTPSICKYKVYIIDEVHMLSIAAFNALLKIMEEPPSHVIFILATTEIHKVPATILSRCQRYDFGRIRPEDIAARIQYIANQEEIELEEGAAVLIARLADGALRDALSILDTCAGVSHQVDEELVRRMAGVTDKSYLFRLSDALQAGQAVAALEELAQLRQRSVDVKRLCEELVAHYRNLMLAGLPSGKELLTGVAPEEEQRYLEKAKQITSTQAIRAIKLLGGAMEKMNRGTDQRIELELALFAIAEPPAVPAQSDIQEIKDTQKNAVPLMRPSNVPLQRNPQAFQTTSQPILQNTPQTAQHPVPDQEQSAEKSTGLDLPIQSDPGDLPPWDTEPVQMKEVPIPAITTAKVISQPQTQEHAPNSESPGQAQLASFEPWTHVIAALESRDPMLHSVLKSSKAYFDGRRVLIDGGEVFRDYIRSRKEGQQLLKALIEEVTGVHCGIGPYISPQDRQVQDRPTLEDTLKMIQAEGVEVIDRPDE